MGNRGFTNVILLIVIIVVALAYFNVDLHGLGAWLMGHPWIAHLWTTTASYWSQYITPAFSWALSFFLSPAITATSTPSH